MRLPLVLALATVSALQSFAHCNDSVPAVRRVSRAAGAVAINAALTEIVKGSVHEMRPDRSDNHSFPSRHTSWAFAIATAGSRELYGYSPWFVTGLHAAASAVGVQRVFAGKHFPKDVAGGEALGIASAVLGEWVIDKLFFRRNGAGCSVGAPYCIAPSIEIANKVLFPLSGGAHTGISTELRAGLPTSEQFGAALALNFTSLPLYDAGKYTDMFNSVGISAGLSWQSAFAEGSSWGVSALVLPGIARKTGHKIAGCSDYSFTFGTTVAATCQIAPKIAIGAECGYHYIHTVRATSSVTLGLFTRTLF